MSGQHLFFGRRLSLPLALYSFLLYFLGILHKLLRFQSFDREVLPHSLYHAGLFPAFSIACHDAPSSPRPLSTANSPKAPDPLPSSFRCNTADTDWPCVDSSSSSTATEANCQNLRALSLHRLSHKNMGLCGMLIALGTKFISSASSRLRLNDSLSQSCVSSWF